MPIIAAVGNTIIEPIPSYASSTVLSAFHPTGAAFWDCRLLYNKDALIRYSDIACLDDVIAAVGCDNNNTGCYVKMFPRISNFVEIGYALTPGQAWKVDAAPTAGPVLAEEIRGNDFAAAQFSQLKTSTVLHRLSNVSFGVGNTAPTVTPVEMDEQAVRFIPTNKTHTLKKEICNIVTECQ